VRHCRSRPGLLPKIPCSSSAPQCDLAARSSLR
jgi:hypothetical protein